MKLPVLTIPFIKTCILPVILILACNIMVSQNIRFDSNFVWTEAHNNAFSPWTTSTRVKLNPTPTVINNLTYYSLLTSVSFEGDEWDTTTNYIRTSNQKVYLLRYDKEIVLYDFEAEIGDKFMTYHDNELEVIDVDTVSIQNGESRRRLKLICTQIPSDPLYWIEGIGSNMGFDQGSVCQFDWYTTSLCAYYKDELLYKHPEVDTCWLVITSSQEITRQSLSVYPNPFEDYITLDIEASQISEIIISDMMGRMVYKGKEREIQVDKPGPGYYSLLVIYKNGIKASSKLIKL